MNFFEWNRSKACKQYEKDAETLADILGNSLPLTGALPLTGGAVGLAAEVRRAIDVIKAAHDELIKAKSAYSQQVMERERRYGEAVKRLRASAKVVLSTLGSSARMTSALGIGDGEDSEDVPHAKTTTTEMSATIICDEASTVHTALFVGAVEKLSAKVDILNVLIIGDDRQLPPYWPVRDEDARRKPTPLFTLAADVAPATQLRQQYRVPRFVMDVLNKHYYNDIPLVYAKLKDARLDDARPVWVDVPTGRAPAGRAPAGRGRAVLAQFAGGNDREQRMARKLTEESLDEADAVLDHAIAALNDKLTVLVTTPYRAQNNLIKREICNRGLEDHLTSGRLVLATVDGGQGQEADVLIISMVKRFPSKFLDANRLCVMLSRGRRRLVMVGDRGSHAECKCKPVRELARMSMED